MSERDLVEESYLAQLEAMTNQELLEEAVGRLLHWIEGITPEQAKEEIRLALAQPLDEWEPPAVTMLRKRLQQVKSQPCNLDMIVTEAEGSLTTQIEARIKRNPYHGRHQPIRFTL